jgi:hypothetical protein
MNERTNEFFDQEDAKAIGDVVDANDGRVQLNGHDAGETAAIEGPLLCEHAPPHPIKSIPPRQWAYGFFLLFRQAAVIGAVDGGGKGAIAVVIALSMITGHPLLDEFIWRTGSVAIVSYEDDEIEWRRRIAAACIHYKLDYESVIKCFYFICRPGSRICLAAQSSRGRVIFPDRNAIIDQLKAIGAVLLIVDPLNHAHSLEDGNNNVLIAKVAGEVTRIARESNVAGLVLHHLRKGATGDADDLMGATSLRATFRACRILARMTAKEAEDLQLSARQAWRYSRIAGTKENYAPPPERATWYKLESTALNNGSELYPEGDNVQVATLWAPPSAFKDISLDMIANLFDKLRSPPEPGLRYSPDPRSDEWVGSPIMEITGKTQEETIRIVHTWIDDGVLVKDQYTSPKGRKSRQCVALSESKAAEMLRSLYRKPGTDE